MDTNQYVICSYCHRKIEDVSFSHYLWKSYKMCIKCKNNLKCCFACEKKIEKNIEDDDYTACSCGSTISNLCKECRRLSVVCCNKNTSTIIAEILYFLDYYLDIKISEEYIMFQNVYSFNKINYNDTNQCCTFEYDAIKNNKIDITHPHYSQFEKDLLNNKIYMQNCSENNYSSASYQSYGSSIFNSKKKSIIHLKGLTKQKKNGIIKNFFSKLKLFKKKDNTNLIHKNETKLEPNKKALKFFNSFKSINLEKEKLKNINNAKFSNLEKEKSKIKSVTKLRTLEKEEIPNIIKNEERINRVLPVSTYYANNKKEKANIQNTKRSLDIYNTEISVFEYIKKLKMMKQNKRNNYNLTSSSIHKENSEGIKSTSINENKILEKYNLNFALYFMNKYNENEMYARLLNNELKYYDILYLNNIIQNKYNEKTVASCGCVTISKERLVQLHDQNKCLDNYKYKNINLEEFLTYDNENIKLIDHFLLGGSLPKISFLFFISHELMHTYIWLSKPIKSKYYEQIYLIVKRLYNSSFVIKNKNNREQHKNLSFYLSEELEEALCIYVSIEFIHHIKYILSKNSNKYDYEIKLINYYIQKYEHSKSLTHGINYRELKKIICNYYKIMDIISIISDICLSNFYPIVTLDLLKAVISLINFKL